MVRFGIVTEDTPPVPEVDADLLRRRYARLRLGIPARFETLYGRQPVRLVDISHGGAHIVLADPAPVREGVLMWMRFEIFGIAMWQEEESVGLEFDRPLSLQCLRATRDFAPEIFREAARDFVSGTDGSLR